MSINLKEVPLSSEQLAAKRSRFNKLGWLPFLTLILGMALLMWFFPLLVSLMDLSAMSLSEDPFSFTIKAVILIIALGLPVNMVYCWKNKINDDIEAYTELDIDRDTMEIKNFLDFSYKNKVVKDYLRQLNKLNRLPTHGEYNLAQEEYSAAQALIKAADKLGFV